MSKWNPPLGYNIELINDLVNDYFEGMNLMMDTEGIDKSAGISRECVLKSPSINKSSLYLET